MRPAVALAVVAILVQAPRLVIASLDAEAIAVPTSWRVALLAASAIATAVVLTGGAAYLAHAVASRRQLRPQLAACWLLVLAATVVLVSPVLVAALSSQHLHEVLADPRAAGIGRWAWALAAVVGVELLAAGAMVAHAAAQQDERSSELSEMSARLDKVYGERNRLQDELRSNHDAGGNASSAASYTSGKGSRWTYECQFCGRGDFGSPQALGGHVRRCPDRPRAAENVAGGG